MRTLIILAITSIILSACKMGSGTRTSRRLYQPTQSADVEILFREPTRPFSVVTCKLFRSTYCGRKCNVSCCSKRGSGTGSECHHNSRSGHWTKL